MAYYLQAILGRQALLERHAGRFGAARVVALEHDFALIPVTTELRAELSGPAKLDAPGAHEADQDVQRRLTIWLENISHDGAVAYVEAEYHSNAGGQDATVWRDGQIVLGPLSATSGAINQALRYLGCHVDPGQADEFDSVGLYRHRRTEQWVETPFR